MRTFALMIVRSKDELLSWSTVIDGPFAESKELIAGYAILELPSKAAAIEWALRFGEVVKVNEVEVRQVPEW